MNSRAAERRVSAISSARLEPAAAAQLAAPATATGQRSEREKERGATLTFAHLDLHPAADVVAGKVGAHNVEHVDGERPEGDRLLVLVVPGAAQLARVVVHLLHVGVVLDDDGVLEVGSAARVAAHPVEAVLGVALGAAAVDADVEVGLLLAAVLAQVHALALAVVALAEDDPVEHLVELDAHLHQVLLALHLQVDDLGDVGRLERPGAGGRLLQGAGRDHRVLEAGGGGESLRAGRLLLLLLLLRARRLLANLNAVALDHRVESGRWNDVAPHRRLLHGQRGLLGRHAHLLLLLLPRVLRVRRRRLVDQLVGGARHLVVHGRRVHLLRVLVRLRVRVQLLLLVLLLLLLLVLLRAVHAGGGRGGNLLLREPVVAGQGRSHERVERLLLVGRVRARHPRLHGQVLRVHHLRLHGRLELLHRLRRLLRLLLLRRRRHEDGRHRGRELLLVGVLLSGAAS